MENEEITESQKTGLVNYNIEKLWERVVKIEVHLNIKQPEEEFVQGEVVYCWDTLDNVITARFVKKRGDYYIAGHELNDGWEKCSKTNPLL